MSSADTVPFTIGLLIKAATCFYAIVGFALSALAALFSLLDRRPNTLPLSDTRAKRPKSSRPQLQTKPSRPSITSPSRSPVRSFSDETPSQPKSILNQPACPSDSEAAAEARKRLLASRRRSRSIPIITIDYFGSTDNLRVRRPGASSNPEGESRDLSLPVRKPLTFVLPAPDRERRPRAKSAGESEEKTASKTSSRLSNGNDSERKRRVSNPQLGEPATTEARIAMRRARSAEFEGKISQSDTETKPRKKPRRLSNAPSEERLTMRFEFGFPRATDKKKTPIPRTQPYDAPYYCPIPAPPRTIRKSATVGDLTSLVKRKLSKQQTVVN